MRAEPVREVPIGLLEQLQAVGLVGLLGAGGALTSNSATYLLSRSSSSSTFSTHLVKVSPGGGDFLGQDLFQLLGSD